MDDYEENDLSPLVLDLQGQIKKLEQENAELRRRKLLQLEEVKRVIVGEVAAAVLQALSVFHGEGVAADSSTKKFRWSSRGINRFPDDDFPVG